MQITTSVGMTASVQNGVQFGFWPEARSSSDARRFVERVCRSWGEQDRIFDAQLIVTELVENVIKHAGTYGEIWLSRRDGRLVIEVSDSDSDFPVLQPSEVPSAGSVLRVRESGRGVRMVHRLARNWGVRATPTGKVVWAEL